MKIDDGFKRRLRRELERRIKAGALPEPMMRLVAGSSLAVTKGRQALPPEGFTGIAALETDLVLQTVVNAFESPSLLIRNHSFEIPASETWADVLEPRRSALETLIPAVGRIEVAHHPTRHWLGTGVLVAPSVVVTNRHVALLMAEESAEGWKFAPGIAGQTIAPSIDFLEEHGLPASAEFDLVDVLAVENESGPDLAFLRVESHADLPLPVPVGGALEPHDAVAVIGYTSRATGMPPEVEDILTNIFGTIYDVKRLAPGRILGAANDRVSHDCSTQGGNSGSALVDIETALVAGIHFEGGLAENFAVPAKVVEDRLAAVA